MTTSHTLNETQMAATGWLLYWWVGVGMGPSAGSHNVFLLMVEVSRGSSSDQHKSGFKTRWVPIR
jgi:hypothetical protein